MLWTSPKLPTMMRITLQLKKWAAYTPSALDWHSTSLCSTMRLPTTPRKHARWLRLLVEFTQTHTHTHTQLSLLAFLSLQAVDDAVTALDSPESEPYKDSTLIMQQLRDHVTVSNWWVYLVAGTSSYALVPPPPFSCGAMRTKVMRTERAITSDTEFTVHRVHRLGTVVHRVHGLFCCCWCLCHVFTKILFLTT